MITKNLKKIMKTRIYVLAVVIVNQIILYPFYFLLILLFIVHTN